MVAKYFH